VQNTVVKETRQKRIVADAMSNVLNGIPNDAD
jgi:hypothetical protein